MHIIATVADRYPNNGLISVSASSKEWEHGAAKVGGLMEEKHRRREEEGVRGGGGEGSRRQGICDAQRLASQPASHLTSQPVSGTLMTIMSCHTSCRASQQILPLSLPFSDQCH